MNPSSLNLTAFAAALIAGSGLASAQTTATTDPVGFVTMDVAGGSNTSPKLTFKALGLTRPVEYQGSAEAAAAGTNTVIDNEATSGYGITPSASTPYYLEITSGTGAGTTYDISGISGSTITLAQNLAVGVVSPVTFKIRKHWTISDVFGANNTAGLTSGDDSSVSDQVLLYTGGSYSGYYYQTAPTGAGGTGWRKVTDVFADAGKTIIYPDDGVLLRRIQSGNLSVVLTGAVKTGQTSVPISAGMNVLSNVYAAPMTLNSCEIYKASTPSASLVSGDDSSTSDQLLLWNGTGYVGYYYQTAPAAAGGTGWRSVTDVFTDAGNTSIPAGAAIIIKRAFGGAFDWKIPQHPAAL